MMIYIEIVGHTYIIYMLILSNIQIHRQKMLQDIN